MRYVRVPEEVAVADVRSEGFCFSPGRYVRFVPPDAGKRGQFAPLDRLVEIRNETVTVDKGANYRYAEIGDIDVNTGGVIFRQSLGFRLPTQRPQRVRRGDVLISTVRTYRKGVGIVTDADGQDLVATNAILALCGVTSHVRGVTLPYVYSFLRSDFFVEQVWSLLHRGVYPRMDTGALGRILIPVATDARACLYVSLLSEAIAGKERAIRDRHTAGLAAIAAELDGGLTERFRYEFPTPQKMLSAGRMDAGFWSVPLQEALHRLSKYRRGAWSSIYDAGFTTRRGPNLAVSVSGPAHYSDRPFGAALPLATPGDISDFMTLPKFRYYGNRRRVDTVRHGEVLFAAKGVREVSIGHTWVNLGQTPFVTNFDSFLIHSPSPARAACLAFLLSYLKSAKVFARLSDTSNGGSFVESHWRALPIPKLEDEFVERIAMLYDSPASAESDSPSMSSFVAQHRARNCTLGIWQLDAEMKALQAELTNAQELIIQGKTVKVPFPD